MTTDYRALCAELADAVREIREYLSDECSTYGLDEALTAVDKALSDADAEDQRRANAAALAQPEPVGPTPSDVTELFYQHMGEGSEVGFENAISEALARWGRPAIAPISVSERLPGPEDCDAEGRCWWCRHLNKEPSWDFGNRQWFYTQWLPASALPLPEGGAV